MSYWEKQTAMFIEEMAAQLVELQSCWLDDVYEIAYRELVRGEAVKTLPPPDRQFVQRLLNLKRNNPELRKWAEERRLNKMENIRQRIDGQNLMIPAGEFKEVTTEKEFFEKLASTIAVYSRNRRKRTNCLKQFSALIFGDVMRKIPV